MPLQAFSIRFRRLAFWLSLLALCSALMAPAAVLAEEMRTGKWTGLCGASLADPQAGHGAQGEGGDSGHCGLCALPALSLPPQAWAPGVRRLEDPAPAMRTDVPRAATLAQPSIRGPPSVF